MLVVSPDFKNQACNRILWKMLWDETIVNDAMTIPTKSRQTSSLPGLGAIIEYPETM